MASLHWCVQLAHHTNAAPPAKPIYKRLRWFKCTCILKYKVSSAGGYGHQLMSLVGDTCDGLLCILGTFCQFHTLACSLLTALVCVTCSSYACSTTSEAYLSTVAMVHMYVHSETIWSAQQMLWPSALSLVGNACAGLLRMPGTFCQFNTSPDTGVCNLLILRMQHHQRSLSIMSCVDAIVIYVLKQVGQFSKCCGHELMSLVGDTCAGLLFIPGTVCQFHTFACLLTPHCTGVCGNVISICMQHHQRSLFLM